MSDQVVLIHGWSADSRSMRSIAALLDASEFETIDLFLGDYPSTDDDVRISDVALRLDEVIAERQAKGELHARFHVIIHSTGALVVRQWLADLTDAGRSSPVDNFLMLAPANFGSPLAHIGRSVLGRMKVGLFNGLQSGTEMLHGLELGSQFQEDLALRDRLTKDDGDTASPYAADGTRPYVIVGALRITGTQILSETGWDGTVRVAGASLDARGLTVDFSDRGQPPQITPWRRRGPLETAFAFVPDRNHLSILRPAEGSAQAGPYRDRLGELILEALRVDNAEAYQGVVRRWREEVTDETRRLASPEAGALRKEVFGRRASSIPRNRFHEHYQVVVNAHDGLGHPIEEFGVWLSAPDPSKPLRRGMADHEIDAHENVLQDVHVNRRASWRRVLHLDRYELMGKDGYFGRRKVETTLLAAISAPPLGRNISYGLDDDEAYGHLPLRPSLPGSQLSDDHEARFLRRHCTHFVEVILPRDIADRAFRLKRYSE
jgi:pimeloyl-ACP methyl ester carboxylesterase